MKPVKDFPFHCDNCRFWRFSRTDQANVCVNGKSSYYGENTAGNHACIDHSPKKEDKK